MLKREKILIGIGVISASILFLLDRFLKDWSWASQPQQPLVGDWLSFVFSGNRYIAFSLPLSGRWLNVLVTIIIVCLLAYLVFLLKNRQVRDAATVYAMVLGSVSNLYDRFYYGYVVDYLELRYFTVFNIADVMIVVSVAIMLIITATEPKQKPDLA